MVFYIYSRKSVYTGKGESVENQVEMCRAYLLAKFPEGEHRVVVYEDEGFSAKNTDRPRFQAMLRDLRREGADYLVCYRLDRISRSVSDFSALIEELNRRGVSFLCIREEFDTAKPMGKAMMYIASVFAQLERETIAERVRDNMRLLARTGRWLGGVTPLGYTSEQVRDMVLEGKVKTACRLVEHHGELAVVDAIFSLYTELHSLSGVAKRLLREGVYSRRGAPLSLPGIKEILQNPVYCTADEAALQYFTDAGAEVCFGLSDCGGGCGILAYNKRDYSQKRAPRQTVDRWIVAVGGHRGRIPGARWVAVQQLLRESVPTGQSPAKVHNEYALLSGRIFCARCGSRMFAKNRSGRGGVFDYLCSRKLRGGASLCGCPNLNGRNTDVLVFAQVAGVVEERGSHLICLLEELRRRLQRGEREGPLAVVEGQMRRCDEETERLVHSLGHGQASPALVRRVSQRMTALEEQRQTLILRREALLAAQAGGDVAELVQTLSRPAACMDLTVEERRTLLSLLVGRVVWDGTELEVFLR